MKKLLLLISLIALFGLASAVTWNVSLMDSYGDGWNGGALTVYVNGSAVLSSVTLPSGYGPANFPIEVNNGDQITTLYSPGSWAYENEYYIYDHNGVLIASQGVGGVNPESITTPIIVVAPIGGPGSVTNPSPASGSGNIALEGTLSWTFGVDSETYDLWFGPTGSMVQVVTGAAAGATGSYPYAGLSSYTQYSWQVIIHNSNRATTNGPVWTFTTSFGPGYVQIGSGTATQAYPYYIGWGHTRSMSLYTNAQIGQAGLLDQIGWNVAAASSIPIPYKIYAMIVTEEVLTAQTWADFVASATLLEEGTYTFGTTGWHNFVLDTPFVYAGGNLLIGVEANYGGGGTGPSPSFYYTVAPTNVHQYWYADSTPPTGTGNLNTSLPNVLLHLNPLGGDPNLAVNPSSWNFGSLLPGGTATKQFTLTNIGGGTVNVSNISVTGDYYSLTVNPAPVGLGSIQNAYFTVQYAPTAIGTHIGNVAITDDLGRNVTNIPLSGSAALSINMQNGSTTLALGEIWNFYDSGGPANMYANYEDYTYTFNAPAGYLVKSQFISFNTEANYDYLHISDGPFNTDPPMATYHGQGLTIPDYTSTDPTGALTFRFTSDGSVTYAGWQAQISLVQVPVGVPDPVTLLSPAFGATGVEILGLALDWAAAPTGGTADYYEVYMSTDEDPVANNEFFWETPTSILYIADTDWVLTDNTRYYWTVVGVSIADGAGAYPPPFNFTTAAEVPFDSIVLNGSVLLQDVTLNWVPYTIDGTLNWDSGINVGEAIGLTEGGTFSVAARFEAPSLVPYAGQYVTTLNFFANDAAATYTLKAWTGADGNYAPTTEIFSQAAPVAAVGWQNVVVPGIAIPATGSLWLGYEITHLAGTFPAGCDEGPAVDYYGDLIYLNGVWDSLHMLAPTLNYNWNISGAVTPTAGREVAMLQNKPVTQNVTGQANRAELAAANNTAVAPNTSRYLQGYNVYRNNVLITPAPIFAQTYLDLALPYDTYTYRVEALFTSSTVVSNDWIAVVEPYVPPVGDLISNPFIIPALPFTASGTTVGFDHDYGPYGDLTGLVNLVNPPTSYFTGSTLSTSPDVVYQLTLTEPTLLAIDLLGSTYDTALALVTAPGTGPENVILINDDYYSSPVPYVSYVNSGSNYVPAGVYYIVIGGYGSASGNYVLNVTTTTAPAMDAPEINAAVDTVLDQMVLSWSQTPGMTYDIYSDVNPYGSFTNLVAANVNDAMYVIPGTPSAMMFYRAVANWSYPMPPSNPTRSLVKVPEKPAE